MVIKASMLYCVSEAGNKSLRTSKLFFHATQTMLECVLENFGIIPNLGYSILLQNFVANDPLLEESLSFFSALSSSAPTPFEPAFFESSSGIPNKKSLSKENL
jgi:hypothetical protein